MDRLYWGKFKKVKGKMTKVWTKKPMTRDEMKEFDDTYGSICSYKFVE